MQNVEQTNIDPNKQKEPEKTKSTVLRTFFDFAKGSKGLIAWAVISMSLGVLFNFLIPQVTRVTIDNILRDERIPSGFLPIINFFGGRDFLRNNLYIIGLIIVALTVIVAVMTYIRRVTSMHCSERVGKRIKDKMYSHIQLLPFSWHSSIQTGDIIQRASQDSDLIKRYIANQFVELFRVVVMMAIGLILMFMMNVQMTLIALLFFLLTLIFSVIYFPKIAKNFMITDTEEGRLTAVLQENLTGIRVVRAFGKQKAEKDKYEKMNASYVSLWVRFGRKLSYFWSSGDLFAGLQTATILFVGAFMAIDGKITVGDLTAFIFYGQMMIWPVRNLGRILAETGKVKTSILRLEEVLYAEPERDLDDECEVPVRGDIEFKNVSFSYNDSRTILSNISFKIKQGQTFGLIGGTGSGKSTIVQLINRLYDPSDGEILIDGTEIRKIKRSHLRKNIGLILQEPFLFSRKINENIAIAADGYTEEELKHYTHIASLDSTIEELSDGFDTVVGERGVTLSGGQKQRLVIARTLIQKTPIVVFDDSLSAVDTETDSKIRDSLRENLSDTTVILISHRITSLMHADQILVLNNGTVEDIGTHAELIARKGTYRRLYELQTNIESEYTQTGGASND